MQLIGYREQRPRGTPEFPVAYYFVDEKHPRYQMPAHFHDEWELVRVVSGRLTMWQDEEEYVAQAGDVLLVPGGVLHSHAPEHCVYQCLVFDLWALFREVEMVKKYLLPFYQQKLLPLRFFSRAEQPQVCSIAAELMDGFAANRDCRELEMMGGISRLFARIFRERLYSQEQESSCGEVGRVEQIKSVLEYIENHYSEPLCLETLARAAGMNPKYLCRRFRAATGRSPMDYTNYYRIERAADLLARSDLPITAVGLECGFLESSYFTKVFRKYKQISPRQYRAANAG